MQRKNQYRDLIDSTLSMPKYQPPKIEPVPLSKIEKMKDALTRQRQMTDAARDAFSIYVTAKRLLSKPKRLEKNVPIDQLHRHMAMHINRFTAEAILRGGLPMSIRVFDRFKAFIDFGDGRTLMLHTRIQSHETERSTASFEVTEQLGADLSIFDQVPHIDFRKEEPTVISSQVWSADIENENQQRKNGK